MNQGSAGRTARQAAADPGPAPALAGQLAEIAEQCTGCGLCVRECSFLQTWGDPKKLAESFDPLDQGALARPYECSLCGLCHAVCPHGLDPAALFLEMRREAFRRGAGKLAEHRGLRAYEKKGTSARYSWYALPQGCDTIFFPGCALTGSRPRVTLQTYARLQRVFPDLGMVLDCCTKPSHDLGDQAYFNTMFGEMTVWLRSQGIARVLVACPNCQQIFSKYAEDIETRSVYEVLPLEPVADGDTAPPRISLHDPCVSRFFDQTQNAVRGLLKEQGFELSEPEHSGRRTLCCGEGGAVGCVSPERARVWTERATGEAGGQPLVSYCAACTQKLARKNPGPASHLLDLVFDRERALSGRSPAAGAPLTYLNRLRVKRHLRRTVPAAVSRERTFRTAPDAARGSLIKNLGVLLVLCLAVFAVRGSGLLDALQEDRLRELIAGYGAWAPLVYMLIYCLAPALFLPGLPLGIVGGILFGPFWGVVYTITAATTGACLAFLISRYVARDLIESRLKGPRWQQLSRRVADNGWKMVALTRLIPLFPFNLLNYAFGLTPVRFSHYALATFVFMLPGCIAFITFSSSLLDLLQGRISPAFVIGSGLLALVALLPVGYRKLRKRPRQPV